MDVEQFFYEHPVFRYEEFADCKSLHGTNKPSSINSALRYYVQAGRITSIRRRLYAVIPPNQSSENLSVDPYLIAGKASENAVLGYHTALELIGLAYSSFAQFTYITTQKNKSFEFQRQRFQPVSVPVALKRKKQVFVATDTIDRQGMLLKVTNKERTFVDMLDRVELCSGWEEVSRAMQNMAALEIDSVIEYCLLLDNLRLNAKVGYFLSQRQGAFSVDNNQLKPLLNALPKMPQYAFKKSYEGCQLIKPWNIFLPLSVIHQSWEEQ